MIKISRQMNRRRRKERSGLIIGSISRPRVVISKSNRYLTLQAINDSDHNTIAYLSTREISDNDLRAKSIKNFKSKEAAEKLGLEFAKLLNEKNIKNIVFDRNGYIYHGKIKAICEKMRELGITF